MGEDKAAKTMTESLAAAANIFHKVGKMLTHFAAAFVKVLKSFMNVVLNIILLAAGQANPKYWHYYTHAKKRRIRKKYRNRILREIERQL